MTLGEYIASKVQDALANALGQVFGSEGGDMKAAAQAGADELAQNMTPGTGGLLGFLEGLPIIGSLIADVVDPLRALLGNAGGMIEGLALGYGLGAITSDIMEPAFASVAYSAHRAALDARIDPTTAARLWAIGVMSQAQADADASDQGMDPNRTAQLHEASKTFPDLANLLDLYNRGTVGLADIQLALTRHGFDPTWAGYLITLSRTLLSPADLALGWLRGDIDDQTLNTYSSQLGVDAADMDVLIANTGEPPGGEEMMSMWRRQIIDQARFERGIRQSRVRNEWIPFLEAAIYQPMSATDAVRAVVENYLDDATGRIIAAQNGLRPDHWPILVESWGRPLALGEMAHLYHRGLASREQFDQAMRESDLKDKYIPQAFELGRTLIPQRQVVTALQHGVISHDEAIAQLQMQGYSQQDAETLVSLGAAEHHAQLKELSKTDISALYVERLISHDEAIAKLHFLGYSEEVAAWILTLARSRHEATLARALTTQVRALYLKHDLTRDEARDKLTAGGMDAQDSEALIDEWDLTRTVPSRTLSEAQTVKAASDGVIAVQQAAERLVGLGYDERDARILLQVAGLVSFESQAPADGQPLSPGSLFGG